MPKTPVKQSANKGASHKHAPANPADMPQFKDDTVHYGSFRGPFTVTISEFGRDFKFDEFSSLGAKFLQAFIRAFGNHIGTYSINNVNTHYYCARRFLTYLLSCRERGGHFQRFLDACSNDFSNITRDDFELILNDYSTLLHQEYGYRTAGLCGLLHATNQLVRALARSGVLPTVLPLKVPKAPPSKKTPTLLEAVGNAHPELDQVLADAYPLYNADPSLRDALRGLLHIGLNIPPDATERAENLAHGERQLLNTIRKHAENAIKSSFTDWNKARQLIAEVNFQEAQHIFDELIYTYISAIDPLEGPLFTPHFKRKRSTVLDKLFRPHDGHSFGRFLRLLYYLYFEKPTVLYEGHNQVSLNLRIINDSLRNYAKRYYREFIESEFPTMDAFLPIGITRLLSADTRLQVSAAILVMIDTGMNPQPCLDLPLNCFADTDNPAFKSIASWKNRAGGKLIVDELPTTIESGLSAYSALCMVKEQNRYLYKICDNNRLTADRLFIRVDGILGEGGYIRLKPITSSWVLNWLTNSLANDANFRNVAVTTRQIRPSVLTAHRAQHGLNAATRKAQHDNPATIQLYTDRPMFHMAYNDKIQHFQELFQAMALIAFDEIPGDITSSIDSIKGHYQEALNSGLGVLRPPAPSEPDAQSADSVQQSPPIIVMTKQNLANLMAFNNYLHESQDRGLSERPELWMEQWLPWLILTDEVIRRAKRGKWASMYLEAKSLQRNQGKIYFPPLW